MNCTRMVICEGVNDEAVSELVRLLQDHVGEIPNLAGHSVLVEEGGRMVLLMTEFRNREDCLL